MSVTIQQQQSSTWEWATPQHGSPLAQSPRVTGSPKKAELVLTPRDDRGRRGTGAALEHLVRNAERLVRDGLCEHLKHCPFLPQNTAETLTQDLATLALPTADYVKALAKTDLIEFTGAANHNTRAVKASGGEAFWADGATSLRITERLVDRIAAVLRGRMIAGHGFPPVLVDNLILHGRERALCAAVGPDMPPLEIVGLVRRLQARHALGPTFLFRALCAGRLSLFETSLAALAGLPIAQVRVQIDSAQFQGFRALYEDSGLPPALFPAFRVALGVVAELGRDRFERCRAEADEQIIRELVQVYDDLCLTNIETVHALLARRVTGRQPGSARLSDLGDCPSIYYGLHRQAS